MTARSLFVAPVRTSVIAAALAVVVFTDGRARADVATTPPEQGYDLGEVQTPRSLAFGGAQNALGTSTTALYGNPSNLPLARVYHIEGIALLSPEARRQTYGAAVVDSITNRLAGGVGGTWSMQDPDGIRRSWIDARLALAYPFGDRLTIGAAARYLRLDQTRTAGPLGASLASGGLPDGPITQTVTFDAGATLIPFEGVRIGVVGKNLTSPGVGVAPTTLDGGIGYSADIVSIEADALVDFTTWSKARARWMAGGELFLASHVPLRLGYRYDDGLRTHAVSGGLGYVDAKWSFEIGLRRDVVGDEKGTFVGMSLRVFYDPGAGAGMATPADGI